MVETPGMSCQTIWGRTVKQKSSSIDPYTEENLRLRRHLAQPCCHLLDGVATIHHHLTPSHEAGVTGSKEGDAGRNLLRLCNPARSKAVHQAAPASYKCCSQHCKRFELLPLPQTFSAVAWSQQRLACICSKACSQAHLLRSRALISVLSSTSSDDMLACHCQRSRPAWAAIFFKLTGPHVHKHESSLRVYTWTVFHSPGKIGPEGEARPP